MFDFCAFILSAAKAAFSGDITCSSVSIGVSEKKKCGRIADVSGKVYQNKIKLSDEATVIWQKHAHETAFSAMVCVLHKDNCRAT